jgi:drebrin-like protein
MAALSIAPEPEPEPEPIESASGAGIRAVVLYDYEVCFRALCTIHSDIDTIVYSTQAMEDNELPLMEGEMIEDIEQIDENWWTGTGAGGKSGLFPGGYPLRSRIP